MIDRSLIKQVSTHLQQRVGGRILTCTERQGPVNECSAVG